MIMDSLLSGSGLEIIFFIAASLAIAVFIIAVALRIGEHNRNKRAPRLDVEAEVVSMRTCIPQRHIRMHLPLNKNAAAYYATFRMESGDWMELRLSVEAYNRLCKGDRGLLSFQGTRYIAFVC